MGRASSLKVEYWRWLKVLWQSWRGKDCQEIYRLLGIIVVDGAAVVEFKSDNSLVAYAIRSYG
jgi:hypothetical protein